jgi:hypothetical protein
LAKAGLEISVDTAGADAGFVRTGEIWQQLEVGGTLAVIAAADFFAIIGQCGTHCSELLGLLLQQPVRAAAGPASSPNSTTKATSLERTFTSRTESMVEHAKPERL